MLAEPTVFVIGAGAGFDISMPVGRTLSRVIADKLNLATAAGDDEIREILRRKATPEHPLEKWIDAAEAVSAAVRYTKSIDGFLHMHGDDEEIKECAKLAIAQTIIEHERRSDLFVRNQANRRKWNNEPKVIDSWFADFLYVLSDGVIPKQNAADAFRHLTVINFNYDRCLEHFLYHSFQDLFRINRSEAAALMQKLTIYHPYGVVGRLDWQEGASVSFGSDRADLQTMALGIQTFNEQLEEGESLLAMKKAMGIARRIVFLGFHFHEQNMRLLEVEPPVTADPVDIYATFIERSVADEEIIRTRLDRVCASRGGIRINKLESKLDCKRLLKDYQNVLLTPRTTTQNPSLLTLITGPGNL